MFVSTSISLGLITLASYISGGLAAPANNITWTECGIAPNSTFECTTVQVPLDWADPSKGLIPLSVIRLPATQQPSQGYMFYNPGGPGGSGLIFLANDGNELQQQLGSSWDVLSWDPRVYDSGPNITLFSTDEEHANFWKQAQGKDRLDAHGNLTTPSDVDFFMSQVPAFDSMAQSFNSMMIEKNGDKLKYVGSCAVTRGLVALVDTIYGRGADVNFWGISYGTVLATYLTQMFPNRVGKVIIDAVFDPYSYANKAPIDWLERDYEDTEKALVRWTEICVANSSKCSLAAKANNTAEGVHKLVKNVLDAAYQNYDGTVWDSLVDFDNLTIINNPRKWTYSLVAQTLMPGLYDSDYRGLISYTIDYIIAEQASINGTSSLQGRSLTFIPHMKRILPYAAASEQNLNPPTELNMILQPIVCGDSIDAPGKTTKQLFEKIVKTSQTVSPIFAPGATPGGVRMFCHRWASRAVER